MAKIHKVTLYLIDHDETNKESIEIALERMADRVDMGLYIAKQSESDPFEWDDGLAINKLTRNINDFEVYMGKE